MLVVDGMFWQCFVVGGVVGGVLCWYVVLWSYMLVLVGGFMV